MSDKEKQKLQDEQSFVLSILGIKGIYAVEPQSNYK